MLERTSGPTPISVNNCEKRTLRRSVGMGISFDGDEGVGESDVMAGGAALGDVELFSFFFDPVGAFFAAP